MCVFRDILPHSSGMRATWETHSECQQRGLGAYIYRYTRIPSWCSQGYIYICIYICMYTCVYMCTHTYIIKMCMYSIYINRLPTALETTPGRWLKRRPMQWNMPVFAGKVRRFFQLHRLRPPSRSQACLVLLPVWYPPTWWCKNAVAAVREVNPRAAAA